MKNYFKFMLAVAIFSVSTLVSVHKAQAKAMASAGCDSSDAECGTDMQGRQICGKFIGGC